MTMASTLTAVFPPGRGERFAHRVIVSLSCYPTDLYTEYVMLAVQHMKVVMAPPLVEHQLRLVPRMGFMPLLPNRVVMGEEIMVRVPMGVVRLET